MSDTPETDDAQWGTGKVTTDFARRLERERDEARRGIRLMAQNAEVWKERADQARRELDIQLESIHFHMERVPVKDHPLRADDAPLSGEEHEKSDTPQTDLWLKQQIVCNYEHEMVSAGFARTLERERNEARNIARWLYQHGMATLKEGAYRRPWVKEVIR